MLRAADDRYDGHSHGNRSKINNSYNKNSKKDIDDNHKSSF